MTTARSKNYKRSIAEASIAELGKLPQKLSSSSYVSSSFVYEDKHSFKTSFFGIYPIVAEAKANPYGAECYFLYYSNALDMLDVMNEQAKEEFDIKGSYFEIRKFELPVSEFESLKLPFEDDN